MRNRLAGIALLMLGGCSGTTVTTLDPDQQIVRGVLDVLVSDGKPVCVQRLTYGDPLQVYRSARRGELQRLYQLGWGSPGPFRPPTMPDQEELAQAVQENRNAGLPEPPSHGDDLPREQRTKLDGAAYGLSPSAVSTRAVVLGQGWLPKGAHAQWWPGGSCNANYVLSSIKRTDHIAFVTVRVDHWATLYALVPGRGRWTAVGQWSSWMY